MKAILDKILRYILIAIIIAMGIWHIVDAIKLQKERKAHSSLKTYYIVLSDKWNKLISQSPHIVKVFIPVVVENNNPVKPIPIYEPPKPDTVPQTPNPISESSEYKTSWYSETYNIGDSIHIFWTARARGIIEEFNIPRIRYPTTITTQTFYIPPDPVDTAAIIKQNFRTLRWGAGGGIGLQNFKFVTFPAFKGGVFVEIKRKVILRTDLSYFDNTAMIWFGIDFYFNRKKKK